MTKIKSDVILKKGPHGWEAWQTNKLLAKVPGFSEESKEEVMKHIPGYENVIESSFIVFITDDEGNHYWDDEDKEVVDSLRWATRYKTEEDARNAVDYRTIEKYIGDYSEISIDEIDDKKLRPEDKWIYASRQIKSSRTIKSGALDWIDKEIQYIQSLGREFARTKKPGVYYTSKTDDAGADLTLRFEDGDVVNIHYGTDLYAQVAKKEIGWGPVIDLVHNLKKDCDVLEKALKSISIKSSNIQSRFNQMDSFKKYTLSEASQYLSALFFDLRTIHFLCTGSEFYTYHELAQELYEQTEDYYDDLVETAIGYDSDIQPMYVLPGDWNFVNENDSFDTNSDSPQNLILSKLKKIYDVLENVQEYNSMVSSKIDGMLEYYDKEIYKLNQALK